MILPDTLGKLALSPHLLLDLVYVVEVVGERCMHVRQRDGRDVQDDFIRSHALIFVPNYDVRHANPVTGHAGVAAADSGGLDDPFGCGRGHNLSMAAPP